MHMSLYVCVFNTFFLTCIIFGLSVLALACLEKMRQGT